MLLVALLFVSAVLGFDSSFNYGCQNGVCKYQFVVPKEVAQYIDEGKLVDEVRTISNSLANLNRTINEYDENDDSVQNFTSKFNDQFSVVNSSAVDWNSEVNAAVKNASNLVSASDYANRTAVLLYQSISCFKQSQNTSSSCFTRPTTVAPQSTIPSTTTVNPSTAEETTVSEGSPSTGQTDVSGASTSEDSGETTKATDEPSPTHAAATLTPTQTLQ
uniref:Uncharacterized protein n=1 Tax=Caenorhabditis japonica TaxID=281687 RepID=A0A8R1DYY5_CAEJA